MAENYTEIPTTDEETTGSNYVPLEGAVQPALSIPLDSGENSQDVSKKFRWTLSWGQNTNRCLGNGDESPSTLPRVLETTEKQFSAVFCGKYCTYALDKDGNAYVWGGGLTCGLGNTVPVPKPIPIDIKITTVACSANHALALTKDGCVYHWGQVFTPLMRGHKFFTLPEKVDMPVRGKRIAAGLFLSLALDEEGYLWHWGRDTVTTTSAQHNSIYNPTKWAGVDIRFTEIATYYLTIAAISTKNELYTWGLNKPQGILGRPQAQASQLPVRVETTQAVSFTKVFMSDTCGMAIDSEFCLWSWGAKGPHLGLGDVKVDVEVPTRIVVPGAKFVSVALGSKVSAALTDTGNVYVWGHQYKAELGLGIEGDSKVAVPTLNPYFTLPVSCISIGEGFGVAVTVPTDKYMGILAWFLNKEEQKSDDANATNDTSEASEAASPPLPSTGYVEQEEDNINVYAYSDDAADDVELPVVPNEGSDLYKAIDEQNYTSYTAVENDDVSESTSDSNYTNYTYSSYPTSEQTPSTTHIPHVTVTQIPEADNWRNWNEEFQTLMAMPRETSEQRIQREIALKKFYTEFVECACAIAKVGGIAGGEKYVVGGMFLKFALDLHGIYGGDEWSRKSASLELLGVDAYLFCHDEVPNLHLPLIAVVDYLGYRLTATSVLPVSKTSLVYGSDDGGRTCHYDNEEVIKMMDKCGEILNLKPHCVTDKNILIRAPCDIEVHQGRDGRFYVLDTARVFPPEFPFPLFGAIKLEVDYTTSGLIDKLDLDKQQLKVLVANMKCMHTAEGLLYYEDKGSLNRLASSFAGTEIYGEAYLLYGLEGRILYYQLRPELVRSYEKPLSPDACSLFGRHNKEIHNAEVKQATIYLKQTVIPQFAAKISNGDLMISNTHELVAAMHQHGINLRYLGFLRTMVTSTRLQRLIFTEMMGRCINNFIKRKLREAPNSSVQRVAVKVFNLLFGNSEASQYYWTQLAKIQLFVKYGECLIRQERDRKFDLRNQLSMPALFVLLQTKTGITFKQEVILRYRQNSESFAVANPFTLSDLEDIRPTVKTLHLGATDTIFNLAAQIGGRAARPRLMPANFTDNQNEDIEQAVTESIVNYFGQSSLEFAQQHIELALRYLLPMNWNLEKAEHHLNIGCEILLKYSLAPAELVAAVLYIQGAIAYAKKEVRNAHQLLMRAMEALVLLSGTGISDLYSSAQDNSVSYLALHPLFLFVMNVLFQIWQDEAMHSDVNHEWALHYLFMWNDYSFPGDGNARRAIFGMTEPLPLVNIKQVNELLNDGIFSVWEPFHFNTKMEAKFGDSPLDDPKTQQWIEEALSLHNTSRQLLDTNLWLQDPSLTGLKIEVMKNGDIWTPLIVRKGDPLEASVSAPRDESLRKCYVYNTNLDDFYITLNSEMKEIQSFIIEQDDTKLDLSSITEKPGRYFLKLRRSYRTEINRVVTVVEDITEFPAYIISMGFTHTYHAFPLLPTDEQVYNMVQHYMNRDRVVELVLTRDGIIKSHFNHNFSGHTKDGTDLHKMEALPTFVGKPMAKFGVGLYSTFSNSYDLAEYVHINFALACTGELYTWGQNSTGALGVAGQDALFTPKVIPQLYGVRLVDAACGLTFMVALTDTGKVYLWGEIWNLTLPENEPYHSQYFVRNNSVSRMVFSKTPTIIEWPNNDDCKIVNIAAGPSHACFVTDYGDVYYLGQLFGTNSAQMANLQLLRFNDPNVRIIRAACGARHTLLLSDEGKVYAFGENRAGQLAQTQTNPVDFSPDLQPVELARFGKYSPKIIQIDAKDYASAALDEDGEVWVWGSFKFAPVRITMTPFVHIRSIAVLRTSKLLLSPLPLYHDGSLPLPKRTRAAWLSNEENKVEQSSQLEKLLGVVHHELRVAIEPILAKLETLQQRLDKFDRRLTALERKIK